jgi:hypothetical protein
MSAYQKLKWKKTLNEFRFLKEEREIIKTLSLAINPEFQEYYEQFLVEHKIDLSELNQKHHNRIKKAYNIEEEQEIGEVPMIEAGSEDLMVCNVPAEKPENIQLTEDEIVIHSLFSKLFKGIAMKIHPDKIDPHKYNFEERRRMTNDFKRANKALEERNYFILIEIAEKLDISLPKNYNQQTRWMKSQLKEMSQQVRKEKLTYNYLFSEQETKEEKDSLMKQFIQQLFGIQIP